MDETTGEYAGGAQLTVNPDGAITTVNEVFARWTGLPAEQIIGRPVDEFLVPAAPGSDQLPDLRLFRRDDGSRMPVFVSATVDRANGSRSMTALNASAQVTFTLQLARRHALAGRTQSRLELVIAAATAFANAEDESTLAEILVDTAAKSYAAEESVVFLLNEAGEFIQVAGTNPFVDLDDVDLLTAQAHELRTVMKISGIAEARIVADAVADAFEKSGVQSVIIAPIHRGDRLLGLWAAFFHHPRQFDEQATPLADALSVQAAAAITNLGLQAQLQHAATHDETTGLPNRRLLEEHLEHRGHHADAFLAVLFVDLDGFKEVNDRFGHITGDQLLKEVGQRLQSNVRDGDLVARYGGDEFVVVCEIADDTAAAEVAERLRASITAPYSSLSGILTLGASIGVSITQTRTETNIDRLIRASDQAMYRAKFSGGNRVVWSEP